MAGCGRGGMRGAGQGRARGAVALVDKSEEKQPYVVIEPSIADVRKSGYNQSWKKALNSCPPDYPDLVQSAPPHGQID
jgi:hypothetical protein